MGGLEARNSVQSQVDPFVWYKEEMVLLFYIDDCQLLNPYKDKINEVYASLQTDFKIEYDGEINKYSGIDLDLRPYGFIHMSQSYLTQQIINMIPGMNKTSDNPTPVVKPPLAKHKGSQSRKNDFNYKSVIGLLDFLTNSTRPEEQFTVNQCTRFSADTKLQNDQTVKRILKYLKGTSEQGLIINFNPEKGI